MSSNPAEITRRAMQTYQDHPGQYYIAFNDNKTACVAKKIDQQTAKNLDERLVSIERNNAVTNVAIRSLPINEENKSELRERRQMYMLIMEHMKDAPEPPQTSVPRTPTTRQPSAQTPSTSVTVHMKDAPEPPQTSAPRTPTTRQPSVQTPSTSIPDDEEFEVIDAPSTSSSSGFLGRLEKQADKLAQTFKRAINTTMQPFSKSSQKNLPQKEPTSSQFQHNAPGFNDSGVSGVNELPVASSSTTVSQPQIKAPGSFAIELYETLVDGLEKSASKLLDETQHYPIIEQQVKILEELQVKLQNLSSLSPENPLFMEIISQFSQIEKAFSASQAMISVETNRVQEDFSQMQQRLSAGLLQIDMNVATYLGHVDRIKSLTERIRNAIRQPSPQPPETEQQIRRVQTAIHSFNDTLSQEIENLNQIRDLPNVAHNKLVFVWNNSQLSTRERKLLGGPKLEFVPLPGQNKGVYIESTSRAAITQLIEYLYSNYALKNGEALLLKDQIENLSTELPTK